MSNFKFLLSDPAFAPFAEVAMAAEKALSVSPLGCHLSQRERQGGRKNVGHSTWLPRWGSWHGVSRD